MGHAQVNKWHEDCRQAQAFCSLLTAQPLSEWPKLIGRLYLLVREESGKDAQEVIDFLLNEKEWMPPL